MPVNKINIKQINGLQQQLNKSLSDVLIVGNTASQNILMGTHSIGLGTPTPSTNLHIDGGFRYVDGNQVDGYILTTDGTGFASWTASANIVDGNGIYTGSGTIPTTTVATITDSLVFKNLSSVNVLTISDSDSVYSSGKSTSVLSTAYGYRTLNSITSGDSNSAFGYRSQTATTSGSNNSSFGVYSLFSLTTGASNTAFGSQSLYGLSTGSMNVAIGLNAGYLLSLGGTNTASQNSIFIGSSTKPKSDSETNQIVIGYNAIGNGSNTATIGNSSIIKTYLSSVTARGPFSTFGDGSMGYVVISDDSYGNELGILTGSNEVIGIKYSDGTFRYGGSTPGSVEPIKVNTSQFTLTLNSTDVIKTNSSSVSTSNNDKYSIIISSKNSTIATNVNNACIIGGNSNTLLSSTSGSGIFASDSSTITGALRSVILGGYNASISTSSGDCAIIGGNNNSISTVANVSCIIGSDNSSIGSGSLRSSILGGSNLVIGVSSDDNAIISGNNNTITGNSNNSCIIGGSNNTINSYIIRSVIIGGSYITASQSDTVYVPKFNIKTLNGTTPTTILARDTNGYIVDGSALVPVGSASTKIKATRSTSQSILNTTETIIIYNTEVYDTLGEHNTGTGRVTIANSGYYHVHGQALSNTTTWAAGAYWIVSIFVNGVLSTRGQRTQTSASAILYLSSVVNADLYFTAGDLVDIRVIHNQGGVVNIYTDANYNQFSIHRIL